MRTENLAEPARLTTDPDVPSDVVRTSIFDTLVQCFRVLNEARVPAERADDVNVVRLCRSLAFNASPQQLSTLVAALTWMLNESAPLEAA
jgi:hypothetical protein